MEYGGSVLDGGLDVLSSGVPVPSDLSVLKLRLYKLVEPFYCIQRQITLEVTLIGRS
jgi:hypothetical protein